MAHFQIWSRIENLGPQRFLAVASAVSSAIDAPAIYVMTDTANSLDDARTALERLVIALGTRVRGGGNSVAGADVR
jgi:hypothetical protein